MIKKEIIRDFMKGMKKKDIILSVAVIIAVIASFTATIIFMTGSVRQYWGDMSEMYESSNLPFELGKRTTKEYAESAGGDYRETNMIELYDGVWEIITYPRNRSGSASNMISGVIWYGNPFDTSFNEEYHVFGIKAGRQWTDDIIEFFTEKGFETQSNVFEGDEYFGFEQPNASYYLRFRVNPDGYIIEIMASLNANV